MTFIPSIYVSNKNYGFYRLGEESDPLPKVVLIAWTEDNPHHYRAVAALLNEAALPNDLLLVEYLDKGRAPCDGDNPIDEKGALNVYNALKACGLQSRELTIKGWDDTRHREAIIGMFTRQIPLDYEVLIGKRNQSLIEAVKENSHRFGRIFVLAGATHFCTPVSSNFPATLKEEWRRDLSGYHDRIQKAFKGRSIILIPHDAANGSNAKACLAAAAAILIAAVYLSGSMMKG